jgi:hypothetical protein
MFSLLENQVILPLWVQWTNTFRHTKLMRNSTLSQVVETKADFWKYSSIYSQTIQDTHKKKHLKPRSIFSINTSK